MEERVSLTKVARSLGVKRRELCARLRNAGIETFEGSVDLDEVKRISPRLATQEGEMNERVRLIRQTARRRPAASAPRSSARELQDELDKMHNQWLAERKKAQEFNVLFDKLVDELGRWQTSDDPARAAFSLEFSKWICKLFDD